MTSDDNFNGLKINDDLTNTMSITEARRMIAELSQPLGDITRLIYDNLLNLNRHEDNLAKDNHSLDELKKNLYIPVIDLEVTRMTEPATVCTSTKCAELILVENVQKWHYNQRCHDPCGLKNVDEEVIGHSDLKCCAAMDDTGTCMQCGCDFQIHMHVYYFTTPVANKIIDQNVKDNISQKQQAVQESQKLIREIKNRKRELEEERDIIIASIALFTQFLKHNAIPPRFDSHKVYIDSLIKREENLGITAHEETIENLKQPLQQYEEIKAAVETSPIIEQLVPSTVTAENVFSKVQELY